MAKDFLFRETLLINNPDAVEAVVGSETIIVCGSAQGMTSAVSFSLYELGYFLGEKLQEENFEDREFFWAFSDPKQNGIPLAERSFLCDLVNRRNAQHQRWGFKLPSAIRHHKELPFVFRNPVVVLCVRNPVATMRSIMRRNPRVLGGFKQAHRAATTWVEALEWLTQNRNLPSVVIDMDAVKRAPDTFLRELSETFSLNGDLEGISKSISNRGYSASSPREVIFLPPRRNTPR